MNEIFFLFNPDNPEDVEEWIRARNGLITRLKELEWEEGVHFAVFPDDRLGFCEELILALHEDVPSHVRCLIASDLVFRAAELDEKS